MRILHTADWHVGKTLRGRSRADEQRAVLAEITALAREREVDLILVAGDLFDAAAPSPEAEKIVYDALMGLAQTGAPIVLVAGNHDHPRRLEAVRPLLALARVHVGATLARPQDGGTIVVETRSGERAALALLPFLSQRDIVRADDLMAGDASDHAALYADRAVRIVEALCANLPEDAVRMLLAHAMVHGGLLGGGERSAHTVSAYAVPVAAFPASLHYVALGHLHRTQKIAAACPVHYCGSPLQLDFGETRDTKSVLIVEASAGRPAQVEAVPIAAGRRLRTIRGTLEQVLESAGDAASEDWLSVEIDAAPHPNLAEEVRAALPHAVEVRLKPRAEEPATERPALAGRSERELFADYLKHCGEEDERLLALFAELLDETHATSLTRA